MFARKQSSQVTLRSSFKNSKRPGQNDGVGTSKWADTLAFARKAVRPTQCRLTIVDPRVLQQELKRKKRKTAKGLDGVSLTDLRAAPVSLLSNICKFYDHALQTDEWPAQMIARRIANIAKVSCPTTPDDFQPITVFGLCYRLWTSIQCRVVPCWLTFMRPFLMDSTVTEKAASQLSFGHMSCGSWKLHAMNSSPALESWLTLLRHSTICLDQSSRPQ